MACTSSVTEHTPPRRNLQIKPDTSYKKREKKKTTKAQQKTAPGISSVTSREDSLALIWERMNRDYNGELWLAIQLTRYCLKTVWQALKWNGTGTDCRDSDMAMQTWELPATVKHMYFHLQPNRAKSQILDSSLSVLCTCETSWRSSIRCWKIITEQDIFLKLNFCEVLISCRRDGEKIHNPCLPSRAKW